jgi:ABC-type multidrug transport system fused ATPase/permease subunit
MERTSSAPPEHARFRFRRLERRFLRPYRVIILLALAGMLVQSLLPLPIPLLQGWVLDQVAHHSSELGTRSAELRVPHSEFRVSNLSWLIVGAMVISVLCYLVRTILGWIVTSVMTRVSLEVVRELTDALHRKLQRLPLAYFDREQTGRVMARITSDVGSLLLFISSGSLQLVSDLVLAAGIAVVLLCLQWQLALVCLVVLPLYACNHRFFAARIKALAAAARVQVAAIYALLSERISAVRVVRSFAREEAELRNLDQRLDAYQATGRSSLWTGALQSALATLISGLGTVAVLIYGVVLVSRDALTVGELLAFYTLLALLYNPIVRLTQFQGIVAGTRVAVDRMMELLDEPEEVSERPGARPIRRPRGALEFRDVSFAYHPEGPKVLDGIQLTIEPGETLGILGPSGSGKSTLLSLVPRLYDVSGAGSVRFDGTDVRDLKLADLRRAVALVPQQSLLFEGTLRSNLTYALPDASVAAIYRALEAVDLADLVDSLPDGLDTRVGERGVSLSGGQRQRLALARALIADPAVLLLDDCTSALDAATEAHVRRALKRLLPGRTRLIVSHKVASVREADRILVLQSGRVAELGTHDQLLARGGLYAALFAQQTRGPQRSQVTALTV